MYRNQYVSKKQIEKLKQLVQKKTKIKNETEKEKKGHARKIRLTYAKQSAFPNSCAQLPEDLSSGKPNGVCNKSSYT